MIALSASVRREKTLFGKIIQSLIENPGCIRPIAQALNISTKAIYSAARAYVLGFTWEEDQKGGRPPLVTEETRQMILNEVNQRISNSERPTFTEIYEIIKKIRITVHSEQISRALLLKVTPVTAIVMENVKDPSESWIYEFIKQNGLKLANPCEITMDRADAATRSNIRHWFNEIFSADIASLFRDASVFNADEINIEFDLSQKVIARMEEKRVPDQNHLEFNGHMTAMITLSSGLRRPPQFILVGGTNNIGDIDEIIDDDVVKIHAGGSG